MLNDEKCVELYSKTSETNVDMEKDIMRQSLSSITREIQRFHLNESFPKNDLFEIIKKFKSSLKLKNRKIKILNENIKTVCFVAKTLISAKKNESIAMKNFMENIENEWTKIKEDNIKFQNEIDDILKKYKEVYSKMKSLQNLINICYKIVQNIRNEPIDDLSLFAKFKTIILFCGQYYADFQDENQRCKLLTQKTNFYQHKLKILQYNLKSVTNELENLRYENLRLRRQRSNDFMTEKSAPFNPDVIESQPYPEKKLNENKKNMLPMIKYKEFDISTHLFLAKSLLADQDIMIRNLNEMSNEVNRSLM